MKVLHLTTHLNVGGITSYLYHLSCGLKELGIEVNVASRGGEQTIDFQKKDISLLYLPLTTKSELSPKLFLSFLKLQKFFKQEKWEIIHAHTRITQCLARVLSNYLKIPYVTTVHGFYPPHWGRTLFPCLGYKTIAISKAVHRFVAHHYPKQANHTTTILHGIDTHYFKPDIIPIEKREKLKQDLGLKNFPILGNVARLAPEKGQAYLLDIISYLKVKKNMDVQLIMMGDGREKESILQKIHHSPCKDRIYLLPAQKDPRAIFSLIDIFVSYHVAPEGFGLSLLEAMAMGKPVVTRYLKGGVNDFLVDGKCGFLLENSSIEAMAEKIYELLISPSLKESMGKAAAIKAHQSFSYQGMARETKDIYEKVLSQ